MSKFDTTNKYYSEVRSDSSRLGVQRRPNVLDHFKTNFSLECKGHINPNTEYDNQRTFQSVDFGKTFTSVNQDKTFIHTVDTFYIPANSHEITYTLTPANNDTSSSKYGRRKNLDDSGGTAIWSFFGVACGAAFGMGSANGMFSVELSKDAGQTYSHLKTFTTDVTTGNAPDVSFQFYDNLPIAEYTIKITQLPGTILTQLGYCWYTTYVNQRGVEQYYYHATTPKAIATELPPCTFQFIGTWTNNEVASVDWGRICSYTATDASYFEFYFYGSKCWVMLRGHTAGDGVFTPLIDGATTYLKATTFDVLNANNNDTWFVRIDNGNLPEGWHTLRVTKTSGVSKTLFVDGVSYYSTNTQTTVTKPVICGKDSYFVDSDNAGWTKTGSWTNSESATITLRRQLYTSTNADTAYITTPNTVNLKAIYAFIGTATDRGNYTASLGGDAVNLRYLNADSSDYQSEDTCVLLYDSFRDGALGNKVLKFTKTDGSTLAIGGLVYEIGDPVENGYLWAFPKLNHMRVTTEVQSAKSNTYRLDVFGICTEGGNWASPYCFSPWISAASTSVWYWRHGFNFYPGKDFSRIWFNDQVGNVPILSQTRSEDYSQYVSAYIPGVVRSTGSNDAKRIAIWPHRVV